MKITYTTTTNVKRQTETVARFDLSQNFPNPFNPTTSISYEIPAAGIVHLAIYSLIGQEQESLVHGNQDAGSHIVRWNGEQFPSGVYIYRLSMGK